MHTARAENWRCARQNRAEAGVLHRFCRGLQQRGSGWRQRRHALLKSRTTTTTRLPPVPISLRREHARAAESEHARTAEEIWSSVYVAIRLTL